MNKSLKFFMCEHIAKEETNTLDPKRCLEILKSQYKGALDNMRSEKIEELIDELMKLSYADKSLFDFNTKAVVKRYWGG